MSNTLEGKRHRLATDKSQDDLFPIEVSMFDDAYSLVGQGVDIFAYEGGGGYCNGPRCVDCGEAKCHHCNKDWWKEDCSA